MASKYSVKHAKESRRHKEQGITPHVAGGVNGGHLRSPGAKSWVTATLSRNDRGMIMDSASGNCRRSVATCGDLRLTIRFWLLIVEVVGKYQTSLIRLVGLCGNYALAKLHSTLRKIQLTPVLVALLKDTIYCYNITQDIRDI